ncbi:MAG: hypothetical protein J4G05_09495 [Chlorobi bacterium]|nr:hypothetical protein [Chlorobiota bacterium]
MEWKTLLEKAEAMLQENPKDRKGGRLYAQAIGGLGNSVEALRLITNHLEIHSDDAQAWDLKSAYLIALERYSDAVAASEQALLSDPTFDIAYYNRACALAHLDREKETIDDLKVAIDCDSDLRGFAREDKSFDGLRKHPEFLRLVEPAE